MMSWWKDRADHGVKLAIQGVASEPYVPLVLEALYPLKLEVDICHTDVHIANERMRALRWRRNSIQYAACGRVASCPVCSIRSTQLARTMKSRLYAVIVMILWFMEMVK